MRTAAERRKRKTTSRPVPDTGDDEGPADIDEFRFMLARRMATFRGAWRTCSAPVCKRAQACLDETMACTANLPRPTPAQSARAAASMYKAVQRAIAERNIGDEDEADGGGPRPARARGR